MIPKFVEAIRALRIVKPATSPDYQTTKPLYIGLDVDFESESAVSAFALYAKLGYNRWWQPCASISYFNYHTLPDPSTSPPDSGLPFSQALLNRQAFLNSRLINPEGPQVYTHFCMVMLWGADDFGAVGKDILTAVQKGLKKYPNVKAKKN